MQLVANPVVSLGVWKTAKEGCYGCRIYQNFGIVLSLFIVLNVTRLILCLCNFLDTLPMSNQQWVDTWLVVRGKMWQRKELASLPCNVVTQDNTSITKWSPKLTYSVGLNINFIDVYRLMKTLLRGQLEISCILGCFVYGVCCSIMPSMCDYIKESTKVVEANSR